MIPYEVIFDVEGLHHKLAVIDKDLLSEEVWSSPERMKDLRKARAAIEERIRPVETVSEKIRYIEESLEILDEEEGDIFSDEIREEISRLRLILDNLDIAIMLSGELDGNNAIVTIHPGAGGVESQDWAQMLMRMYFKWAESHDMQTKIIDIQSGDEAGIKAVTFTVEGRNAYGYLKAEAGIHRLVRISPFDANSRRHTSFSSVFVYPEIEDNGVIEVREEDLKVDTFRSSGAGGQHVNKVSSAVRITHIPTGIIVSCQSERSQFRNKEIALRIIKSRLFDLQMKEKEKRLENIVGEKKDISWGNQIRSYVLQPYRLVKDHRTGLETGNVDAVLAGEMHFFIEAYLKEAAGAAKT